MKDYKQVRKNLIDMLEDIDEQLGEITADENLEEPVTEGCNKQTVEVENGEVSDSFENVHQGLIEKIKQTISRIYK